MFRLPFLPTLLTVLVCLAMSGGPAPAQGWTEHSLENVRFEVPAGWVQTMQARDELDFDSADGRYSLWARWWLPDEPLLGYSDIVAHEELTLGGEKVLWIHSEFEAERVLQLAFDRKDDEGRQFLFQLWARDVPLEDHKAMLRDLVAHMAFGTDQPEAAASGDAWLGHLATRLGPDCRLLDLAGWDHPTRDVMTDAGVTISFVALCRQDTYPVFGVEFPYDPQAATSDYFHPLYIDMLQANGSWDYSFLVPGDRLMIDIAITAQGALDISVDTLPGT